MVTLLNNSPKNELLNHSLLFKIILKENNQSYLEQLSKIIDYALNTKYQELYEKNHNYKSSLEDTIIEILDILNFDQQGQVRYLWMGLILADAVFPTIKAYLPKDQRPEKTFNLIGKFLDNQEIKAQIKLFLNHDLGAISEGYQALDEALDVLRNLLTIINAELAKEALLEILDNCLEGYAIFPGSQDRRDLFNWWLLEVIPASFNLEKPPHLYTINGKVNY